ncbi:MAG: class IV adenylate cyclase [Terriglobales bacterium]
MPEEIELKFPLAAWAALGTRLRALGFRVARKRMRERNWIFDDPRQSLRRGGKLLRLRHAGTKWRLTAKGPRRAGALKRRAEAETEIADGGACRAVLELLGWRESACYERWRTVWRRPGEAGEVARDETPFGVYLEIEGAAAWVRSMARELGLAIAKAEPRSYPELYACFTARRRRDRRWKAPGR